MYLHLKTAEKITSLHQVELTQKAFSSSHLLSLMFHSISPSSFLFVYSFQIINTYTEAVQTVDPFKATGKTHTLWVSFAKFYEVNGQIEDVSDALGRGKHCPNLFPASFS